LIQAFEVTVQLWEIDWSLVPIAKCVYVAEGLCQDFPGFKVGPFLLIVKFAIVFSHDGCLNFPLNNRTQHVQVTAIKVDSVIIWGIASVNGIVKEKSSSRSHCPTGDNNHFVIAEV
jgi:hypothetical protein